MNRTITEANYSFSISHHWTIITFGYDFCHQATISTLLISYKKGVAGIPSKIDKGFFTMANGYNVLISMYNKAILDDWAFFL